jgi:hypothetical protein
VRVVGITVALDHRGKSEGDLERKKVLLQKKVLTSGAWFGRKMGSDERGKILARQEKGG